MAGFVGRDVDFEWGADSLPRQYLASARRAGPSASRSVRWAAGGNSGFKALNLAVQFGAKRILLVGFDMQGSHWHRDHGPRLRNPTTNALEQGRERLDAAAPVYRDWGVEILKAIPISALLAYPSLGRLQRHYRPMR